MQVIPHTQVQKVCGGLSLSREDLSHSIAMFAAGACFTKIIGDSKEHVWMRIISPIGVAALASLGATICYIGTQAIAESMLGVPENVTASIQNFFK